MATIQFSRAKKKFIYEPRIGTIGSKNLYADKHWTLTEKLKEYFVLGEVRLGYK